MAWGFDDSYEVYVDLELPESVIHNSCVVDDYINVSEGGDCCFERLCSWKKRNKGEW